MSSAKRATEHTPKRRIAVAGAITAAALLLAACGSDDDMNGMDHGGESAARPFNDADVAFAQGMIPHHQQAVEMSELADGRAAGTEIKALAGEIEKAQGPEITTMRSWLRAWGEPEAAESGMPGMDHGSGGSDDTSGSGHAAGMMSGRDMRELTAAKGAEFDEKFARLMIEHHNGAIAMARDQRKNGENTTAKKLAAEVIEAQTAEVEQLNRILGRL
ncbi:DUF305 domain-containing protein [Streptomyces sp. NP-1717]|uniref:DUF305 domain-containing protein n=1 Tax=Streptomyces sp. NP-1717 TaxID=2704470 RepID=UPI001F5CC8AA|nr:DUF305 domain-containing protein [Streptomyces sp. NP-1717]MCI3223429.1 DUF305 domain-containing protein [Streptomyces sp. NP-1717]